jgi:hypothetical protein
MLQVGRYRTERGELLRYGIDPSGRTCWEVERSDGSVREGYEICDAGVLLSDDPAWPGLDPRSLPSLLVVD